MMKMRIKGGKWIPAGVYDAVHSLADLKALEGPEDLTLEPVFHLSIPGSPLAPELVRSLDASGFLEADSSCSSSYSCDTTSSHPSRDTGLWEMAVFLRIKMWPVV